jgi:hypothetical protein
VWETNVLEEEARRALFYKVIINIHISMRSLLKIVEAQDSMLFGG